MKAENIHEGVSLADQKHDTESRMKEILDLRSTFYQAVADDKISVDVYDYLPVKIRTELRDAIKASAKDADPEKFYLWHILIGSTPQGKESLAFDTPDGVIEAFMRKEFALPPEVL